LAALLLASLVGRLPLGINGLAILLFVRDATGSFAIAGLAAGAQALGGALSRPLGGRLIDRRGTGLLVPIAAVNAALLGALGALGEGGGSTALIVAASIGCGATVPPLSSVLRARWTRLVDGDPALISAAFAMDTVLIQAAFVSGPLVAALVIAVAAPAAALLVSAACGLLGTAWFAAALRHQLGGEPGGQPAASRGGAGGALSSPGLRTLTAASVPVGFCMGCIEVAIPAFSEAHGVASSAGILLACWIASSTVAGLAYGALVRGRPVVRLHAAMAVLLPLASLPMVLAGSPLAMAALAIPAGAPLAPLIASRNQLIASVAPPGREAEAYAWPLTAMIMGLSAGIGVSGPLVEQGGWANPIMLGAAVASLGGALVLARRATLTPPTTGLAPEGIAA
jgi:MFS family permease